MKTIAKRKTKVNEQGWEETERLPYGIRFWGGPSCGPHVVILETVKLQRMIEGELHCRSEIQEADTIYPRDLLKNPNLYRLVESADHVAGWVRDGLSEDKAVVARTKARGTRSR